MKWLPFRKSQKKADQPDSQNPSMLAIRPESLPPSLRETTEEIVGWRIWLLREDGILISPVKEVEWEGPVLVADYASSWADIRPKTFEESFNGDDTVGAGIHAHLSSKQVYVVAQMGVEFNEITGEHQLIVPFMQKAMKFFAISSPIEVMRPAIIVAGQVRLLGRVKIHKEGYRAERGQVIKLWVHHNLKDHPVREKMAERYQCDVEVWGEDA